MFVTMHRLGLFAVLAAAAIAAGCKPRTSAPAAAAPAHHCLPAGEGFLRARLHGARDLQIDWRDAQMRCEGGLRPDASGIRVSIAGTTGAGEPLRFVFGISSARPREDGRALPTNLTTILEREHQIYATRGDDKCTVDELRQQALPGAGNPAWRVEARGFCTEPASLIGGDERLLVSTFDFAARIDPEAGPPLPAKPAPVAAP